MKLLRFAIIAVLAGYIGLFASAEHQLSTRKLTLSTPLPAPVQRVALGFLQHIGAEILFVKAAVFLGAPADMLPEASEYAENLAHNFDVVSDVYPQFKDTYYLTQSSLAYISPEMAGRAIEILDKGIVALPDNVILPFFKGFDHYYYRGENRHAAEIFTKLAQRPGAPTWLGHLAAILSVSGGDLRAGLLSLQVMHATEEDERVKERYARDIVYFERALTVFEATVAYQQKHGVYPQQLEALIPEFLDALPDIGHEFEYLWVPPRLRLIRPLK